MTVYFCIQCIFSASLRIAVGIAFFYFIWCLCINKLGRRGICHYHFVNPVFLCMNRGRWTNRNSCRRWATSRRWAASWRWKASRWGRRRERWGGRKTRGWDSRGWRETSPGWGRRRCTNSRRLAITYAAAFAFDFFCLFFSLDGSECLCSIKIILLDAIELYFMSAFRWGRGKARGRDSSRGRGNSWKRGGGRGVQITSTTGRVLLQFVMLFCIGKSLFFI